MNRGFAANARDVGARLRALRAHADRGVVARRALAADVNVVAVAARDAYSRLVHDGDVVVACGIVPQRTVVTGRVVVPGNVAWESVGANGRVPTSE